MKDEKIIVRWWSRQEAFNLKPHDNACLISIFTPGDVAPILPGWKWFWQDSFHDVDFFTEHSIYKPINEAQAELLFGFIDKIKDRGITNVNIHCDAGISRSAAVARFIDDYYKVDKFPLLYHQYNKAVYRALLIISKGDDADISYEEWWSGT